MPSFYWDDLLLRETAGDSKKNGRCPLFRQNGFKGFGRDYGS